MKKIARVLAGVIGFIGIVIIAWVFLPIITYQINSPKLMTFLSPIGEAQILGSSDGLDYTKASSFFPDAKAAGPLEDEKIKEYRISITRLGIKNASVKVGTDDLTDSLIHYEGTAMPGRNGNAVIFGHSVLPAFYNPKNYLTIFSTLPTIGKGDTITVDFDGITYKYQVYDKFEVEPTDVGILNQTYDNSYLTLVTCVPPGLQTRRLIVKAKIVPVKST